MNRWFIYVTLSNKHLTVLCIYYFGSCTKCKFIKVYDLNLLKIDMIMTNNCFNISRNYALYAFFEYSKKMRIYVCIILLCQNNLKLWGYANGNMIF